MSPESAGFRWQRTHAYKATPGGTRRHGARSETYSWGLGTEEASEEERQMEDKEVLVVCGSHKSNGDSGFMYLLMGMVPWQQTPSMVCG